MRRLPTAKRAMILNMLVEGMSMRAIARVTDVSFNTVAKLLRDAGEACAAYHDEHVHGVRGRRHLQCDEIWSFTYAKEANLPAAKSPPEQAGDTWTFTAIDTESKLLVSYLIGPRDGESALALMDDLRARLEDRPQISTDGLAAYMAKANTSHVERHNLTMRMGMRRFTRLTNGFSKRIEKHVAMVHLYAVHYNYCRVHKTLRVTPAMEAKVETTMRDAEWIVGLIDARAPKPNRPKTYRKRHVSN